LCFLLSSGKVQSQTQFKWLQKASFVIDSNDIWATDVLGHTYLSKKETIQKFDSIGKFKFSQSQKSSGRLSSIQPINTMKVAVFSEEQQEICFFDNTLTPYESCVNLEDLSISYASMTAVSSQPGKFWVYDQLNSRLHLLSLELTNQSQEIENLKGMLNSIQLNSMFENANFLYLIDCKQGVFVLDMYGSLVNLIKRINFKSFQVDSKNYYFIEGNFLIIINKETFEETKIELPSQDIIEFKKSMDSYFFRTSKEIIKYQLF
jgi:hypothetical protein